jgi:hypothetical protein
MFIREGSRGKIFVYHGTWMRPEEMFAPETVFWKTDNAAHFIV